MRERGFTLLEVLAVVAVVGILAAIVTANIVGAVHRARQKSTLSKVSTLGNAVETVYAMCGAYPIPATRRLVDGCSPPTPTPLGEGFAASRVLRNVAEVACDGWKRPIVYGYATGDNENVTPDEEDCTRYFPGARWTTHGYSIHSRGRDGRDDCGPARYDPRTGTFSTSRPACGETPCGAFSGFDCDVVYAAGVFIARPSGPQR